ncbi:uncharacterized protein TM35_000371930 [Trypanosoma theileri]|uniref:Fanconi-associated nuclease n=1 Tax=Trypanosoma theileri TaxID=67003 RepID=A0A1X0NM68_9TRYP|nr:uncharacterized protein TM35_000371930 [Trypanosoma theileri]ORC85220.1 hypothetical protein TM35_000371930 [Trypanosoma theileri]
MIKKDGSSDSILWEMTPTPLVEAFHTAMWFLLQYYRNVVHMRDLLTWRRLLMIPETTISGKLTPAGYAEELELLLRLSLRTATWIRVRQIEEKYAEYMHVRPALSRLTRHSSSSYTTNTNITNITNIEEKNEGREEEEEEEVLLGVFNGIYIAKSLSSADKTTTTREILRTARVSELRQLVQLQSLPRRKPQSPFINNLRNEEEVHQNDNDNNNDFLEMDSSVAGRTSSSVGRSSSAIPSRKEELIDRILLIKCHESTFAEAWDTLIGPICKVNQSFKASVEKFCEMLHVMISPCGIGGLISGMNAFSLIYPPSISLFFLAPKLIARRREEEEEIEVDVDVVVGGSSSIHTSSVPPWWTRSVNTEELYTFSVPLCLFSSSETLESYLQALRVHHKLLQANEGRTWRRWNMNFIMTLHNNIEAGIFQLQQQELQDHKQQKNLRLSSNDITNQRGEILQKKNPLKDSFYVDEKLSYNMPTVESLLQQGGLLYEHLLPFLPKHAWFACAELLIEVLQYNKKWDLANKWLWRLLNEPVHAVISPCGSVNLPFYYRFQKRGEWWHRMAQNLQHLGNKKEALELLISQQKDWREQETAKNYFKMEKPESLPVSIQRRARILRALFPPMKTTNEEKSSQQKNLALYNAIGEYHRLHFCRRSDRIAIEGMLANLHKSLRRWTPFPSSYMSFTKHLLRAKEITIHASRDPVHHTLWSNPHHTWDACQVEEYVLRWFGATRHSSFHSLKNEDKKKMMNKDNESWIGIHCEGRWIECLARLLFQDAYFLNPDTEEDKEISGSPQFVWLSQIQNEPLDLSTSISFVCRRQKIIEERLKFFEQCPRDTLIEYVKQSCRYSRDPPVPANRIDNTVNTPKESFHENIDENENEEEVSLLGSEDDENTILPGQLTQQKDDEEDQQEEKEKEKKKGSSFSFFPSSSVGHRVDIGDFPLLSLLQSIPQGPLCALLRCIYLSPSESGYNISFSGFPDLVLWRETPSLFSETNFKLVEVKGPNDTLSTKQIAVIDTLCRCGFDVSVARVVDMNEGMENKGRRSGNQVSPDTVDDVILLDAEPHTPRV